MWAVTGTKEVSLSGKHLCGRTRHLVPAGLSLLSFQFSSSPHHSSR